MKPSKSRVHQPATWRVPSEPRATTPLVSPRCAASAQAIGEAVEVIRRGAADVMLTGGSHSMIHPFGVTGFVLADGDVESERSAREREPAIRP